MKNETVFVHNQEMKNAGLHALGDKHSKIKRFTWSAEFWKHILMLKLIFMMQPKMHLPLATFNLGLTVLNKKHDFVRKRHQGFHCEVTMVSQAMFRPRYFFVIPETVLGYPLKWLHK